MSDIQRQIGEWAKAKFPSDLWSRLGKLDEEVTEVIEAVSDLIDARAEDSLIQRVKDDYRDALIREIGDVCVVLHSIAHNEGFDLAEANADAFERAKLKHGERP